MSGSISESLLRTYKYWMVQQKGYDTPGFLVASETTTMVPMADKDDWILGDFHGTTNHCTWTYYSAVDQVIVRDTTFVPTTRDKMKMLLKTLYDINLPDYL